MKGDIKMEKAPLDIILIEDNPADVELTLRALKRNRISNRIIVLKDGEEALDFFFARGSYKNRPDQQPKLILLDLKLPKVDGLEVLRVLKSDPKLKMIPVVVLTSSRQETDMVKSYQIGVNSYIVKPVEFEQFVKAIKELGLYWLLLNELPKNEI